MTAPIEKTKNPESDFATKFRDDFMKDVQAAKIRHRIMNYHYLQYRGILYLNSVYGQEYMKSIGLQVNVPRTFMTVESIRPHLTNKPLDIGAKAWNNNAKPYRDKARDVLLGEWARSKGQNAKADAETDALIFGTGYLLSKYVEDVLETDVLDGYDDEGKPITKPGKLTRYQGMRAVHISPYHVFRDRNATTNEVGNSGTWNHAYIYSIWDLDTWKKLCEDNKFNTVGMEKGGHLEEFDQVRRKIDSLYAYTEMRNRSNDGSVIINTEGEYQAPDWENSIMVVERFEENSYSICSGANWTVNYKGDNPDPDKIIPIHVFRDYHIPGEFEGIGEPEVLRWQQYEENKIHNLAYLQMLMNTVQRMAIVPELLQDPTEVRMNNPLKPIYLKYRNGARIDDAVQMLPQGKGTQYPKEFLQEIKSIGQSASGIGDGTIGATKLATDTATEANILQDASLSRINQKIFEMEERDLTPLLEHWLACIPYYYSDELDMLITDKEDYYAKFIPYNRDYNTNASLVAEYSVREGVPEGVFTVEDVFLKKGFKNVIFVSDIINKFKISIKTVMAQSDRQNMIKDLREIIVDMENANKVLVSMGQPPNYKTPELYKELLRQFPDIIENVDDYVYSPEEQQQMLIQQQTQVTNPPTEASV